MISKTAMRGLLGLALLVAVGVALTQRGRFDAATLQAWVEGAGAAGPLLFMGLYAVAAVLFLPGAVITVLALADPDFLGGVGEGQVPG